MSENEKLKDFAYLLEEKDIPLESLSNIEEKVLLSFYDVLDKNLKELDDDVLKKEVKNIVINRFKIFKEGLEKPILTFEAERKLTKRLDAELSDALGSCIREYDKSKLDDTLGSIIKERLEGYRNLKSKDGDLFVLESHVNDSISRLIAEKIQKKLEDKSFFGKKKIDELADTYISNILLGFDSIGNLTDNKILQEQIDKAVGVAVGEKLKDHIVFANSSKTISDFFERNIHGEILANIDFEQINKNISASIQDEIQNIVKNEISKSLDGIPCVNADCKETAYASCEYVNK